MPRSRRDFDRISGVRDPSLIVIATEGELTEQSYFLSLKDKLDRLDSEGSHRLKLEVLDASVNDETRQKGCSSPSAVLRQMDCYYKEFGLGQYDELCIVIDRDKQTWTEKELANVAKECASKGYFLALSNPSFEIWLLLHFESLTELSEEIKNQVVENKRGYLKQRLREFGINASRLNLNDLWPNTQIAIQRARAMDIEPKDRWPNDIGTRVYLVVEKIKKAFEL